jgi:hypothetical protein
MATIRQIDANLRNALKSTGPRTPEGKATIRMNALRHGLRARTVVLPGENRDEFHQLCDDLEAEWQPQSRTEQFYLEQMAVSQWKLNRMEAGEANLCKETVISKSQVPLLDRLWKAQSGMERSYARAQRELDRLQKSRRPEPNEPVEEAAPAPQPTVDVPYAAADAAANADAVVGQPAKRGLPTLVTNPRAGCDPAHPQNDSVSVAKADSHIPGVG